MSWLAQTGRCPRVPARREVSCGGFGGRHGDCGVAGSALGHAGRCMQPPLSAGVFSLLHPAKQCTLVILEIMMYAWRVLFAAPFIAVGPGQTVFFCYPPLRVLQHSHGLYIVANEIHRSGTALEHILLCGFHAVAAGVFIVQFARQFRRGTFGAWCISGTVISRPSVTALLHAGRRVWVCC